MVHCDELSAQGHRQTCRPVSFVLGYLLHHVVRLAAGSSSGQDQVASYLSHPPVGSSGLQWAPVGPRGQPAFLSKPSSTGSRNWDQRVSILFDKLDQPPLLQIQGEPWPADSSLLLFPFPPSLPLLFPSLHPWWCPFLMPNSSLFLSYMPVF